MADRVGQEVGKYRLIRKLGTGGFAEVYLGEHIELGTLAAIKLLHGSLLSASEIEQFRQEARTIARLVHPNIVRVLDFDAQGSMPYLVIDFAPGGALRQKFVPGTILPVTFVMPYVQQIAQGLQYAHDHKIVHRDIKPQNLLIGRTGDILLSDFGISVVAETTARQQQSQGFAGTLTYAAPEQIQGHPRPESDQYSLAMIVYEWLTGAPAFSGTLIEMMWKQVNTPPPSMRSKVPAIPPAVEQVILKALSKEPADRYPSIKAFADALTQASISNTLERGTPPQAPQISWNSGQRPSFSQPGDWSVPPPPPPPYPLVSTSPPPSPFTYTPPTPLPQHVPAAKGTSRLAKGLLIALIVVILGGAGAAAYAIITPGKKGPPVVTGATPTNRATPTDTPMPPTATTNPVAPYTAQVPGPNCDQGGAVWTPYTPTTSVQCTSSGLEVTTPANAATLAQITFTWPGHAFPKNYSVEVDITNLGANTCAGIATRRTGSSGYAFFACSDGYWNIVSYDNSGQPTVLANGNFSASSSYHLQVSANGNAQALSINGSSTHSLSDSSHQTTDFLALDLYSSNSTGSAVFSDFVYTPLP